jgi:hypothetical protein
MTLLSIPSFFRLSAEPRELADVELGRGQKPRHSFTCN